MNGRNENNRTIKYNGHPSRSHKPNQGPRKIRTRTLTPPSAKSTPGMRPARVRHDVLLRLFILFGFFALMFYAFNAGWMHVRNIDVQGGIRLSDSQIVELAGLEDFKDAWTIFIPGNTIANSLSGNPLIEYADVDMVNPWTLRITITERQPVAYAEYNGSKFLFDSTAELIRIVGPSDACLYPTAKGVPIGLLKMRGESLYLTSAAWSLPDDIADPATMELQLNRLMHLQRLLSLYGSDANRTLSGVEMDKNGRLTVEFENCPPVILGDFDNPDIQFRRMLAILDNGRINDPGRTRDIDLSSELYPCYHVLDRFLTSEERRAIERWAIEKAAEEARQEEAAGTESEIATSAENPSEDGSQEVIIDTSIFNLASNARSDDTE